MAGRGLKRAVKQNDSKRWKKKKKNNQDFFATPLQYVRATNIVSYNTKTLSLMTFYEKSHK